jgi:aerobic-type carbon monoxide dehydrogenase small subunit (CoxS/CutS family)
MELSVNGVLATVRAAPGRSLLFALRNDLGLTGAKLGCGEGECGACTVLLDGHPVRSCQVSLDEAAGRRVVTVEGLARPGELSDVQKAFLEVGAFQCGYCTPGFVVQVTALLAENPDPTEEAIRSALDGNICRCGGYAKILRAVERARQIGPKGRSAT